MGIGAQGSSRMRNKFQGAEIMRWQRRVLTAGLVLLFMSNPFGLCAQTRFSDEPAAVRMLVKKLANNLQVDSLMVKIGTITLENTKISSEFAENLLVLLTAEMTRPNYLYDFIEVERQRLSRSIMPKTRGGLQRIDSPNSEPETEAFLSGSYRESPDKTTVFVSVQIINGNGGKISSAEVALDRSAIRLPLRPPNANQIQKTAKKINAVSKSKSAFQIDLWLDRGNGGTYHGGDELKLMFRTERTCYLKVLYIAADNSRILMYPTERDPKSKLSAGVTHELHMNNKYTVQPPFGTERIMAFASTARFPDSGETYLGGGFSGYTKGHSTSSIVKNLRGLAVAGRKDKGKRAEATVFLTTMP